MIGDRDHQGANLPRLMLDKSATLDHRMSFERMTAFSPALLKVQCKALKPVYPLVETPNTT